MSTVLIQRFGAELRTRPAEGEGAWAELLAPLDGRPGRPVIAWAFGDDEDSALAEMLERLSLGDASTPCRVCAGPSAATLLDARSMRSGHPAQGLIVARGRALCGVCLDCSDAVSDMDGGWS